MIAASTVLSVGCETALMVLAPGSQSSLRGSQLALHRMRAFQRPKRVDVERASLHHTKLESAPMPRPQFSTHQDPCGGVRTRKGRRAARFLGADVVISIGCDLQGLPAPRGTLLNWDEVPALSEDFARADERIRERVIQLVDELVRKQQR